MGMLSRQLHSAPSAIDRMREEFDRALQNLWNGNGEWEGATSVGKWEPSVDISETDSTLEVKVDLPGIKPEDIDISVTDDMLTIKGQRQEEKKTEDKERKVHRVERHYGSFYRSIPLPPGTKPDDVVAESDHGVVTITLPKTEPTKAKKVSVKPK
ncbi:Spore protein SP21 [Stieleria varia]|uniref:Spore protein SP21 n=2 Tax=Stieleria varia TaxID=2528005 RepID=A0A5C5ZPK8_9BACT|nr:Spore protein SP21 [Stieleria varia]